MLSPADSANVRSFQPTQHVADSFGTFDGASSRLVAGPQNAYPTLWTVRMNRACSGVSETARRISATRMLRLVSTTNVRGQILACNSAFLTTLGLCSIKVQRTS